MKKAHLFKKRWEEGRQIELEVQKKLEELKVKWIWKSVNFKAPDFAILVGQIPLFIEVTSDNSRQLDFYLAEWKYEFLMNYPLIVVYKKKALNEYYTFLLLSKDELEKTEYKDKITNKSYYKIKSPSFMWKNNINEEILQMAKGKIAEWWLK